MTHKKAGTTMRKAARRLLLIAVACILALGMFAGCSNTEEKRVHLTIKVPRTGHDVAFDESITQIDQVIQKMADAFVANYDKVPVDIDVEVFEQNRYDDAVVETFNTPHAPDVLYGDYFNTSTYIHTGRVVTLDDIITDDLREDVYDYLWDMSTLDGHVYLMPYLTRQNVLAYNKDLFRQAALENYIVDGQIQSWTKDEWTHILDTLAANLPESVYPMMMYAASSQGDTHIMTLLRSAGSTFFDETGHFALSTPEGIEALQWIQDGVKRGWFPPHSENLEIEDCSSLFRLGQLAIYMVNNASIGRYGDTIGLVNFPGNGDHGCATTFVSGFEVFDNGDPQRLEVAKDFLSFVYSNEELLSYSAGTLPVLKSISDRYGKDIYAFELFSNNRKNVVDFTGSNPDTRAVREIFYECIHDLLMGNMDATETAHKIDTLCNEAIDKGISTSTLHE